MTAVRRNVLFLAAAFAAWACGSVASQGSSPSGGSGGAPRNGSAGGAFSDRSGPFGPAGSPVGGAAGTSAGGSSFGGVPGVGGFMAGSGGRASLGSGGTSAPDAAATTGGVRVDAGRTGAAGVRVDAGRGGAAGAHADGGPFTGPCNFVFQVTTVTAGGKYAPHNVTAIWIQTQAGEFVKTLRVWGLIMLRDATSWTAVSMGARVDAVTGATRNNHGRVRATWNCTDNAQEPVPDGPYQVCVTFAESNTVPPPTSPFICGAFEKGATPFDIWPKSSSPNFVDMHLFFEPL